MLFSLNVCLGSSDVEIDRMNLCTDVSFVYHVFVARDSVAKAIIVVS